MIALFPLRIQSFSYLKTKDILNFALLNAFWYDSHDPNVLKLMVHSGGISLLVEGILNYNFMPTAEKL